MEAKNHHFSCDFYPILVLITISPCDRSRRGEGDSANEHTSHTILILSTRCVHNTCLCLCASASCDGRDAVQEHGRTKNLPKNGQKRAAVQTSYTSVYYAWRAHNYACATPTIYCLLLLYYYTTSSTAPLLLLQYILYGM